MTPTVRPEWRTNTVLELCRSMREAQDFGALPILADALQDADCPDEELLARLRQGPKGYAGDAALVACVMSEEGRASVEWLRSFPSGHDCPEFETLFNAATGNHRLNEDPDEKVASWGRYQCSENDGGYLHFGSWDAHGEIPEEFWDHVERVSGKAIRDRPSSFSCSC